MNSRDYAAEAREVIDNLGWQQTDSECQMQIVRHIMDLAGLVADLAGELRDMQQVRQWNEGRTSACVGDPILLGIQGTWK
jgi:hypothetical protein